MTPTRRAAWPKVGDTVRWIKARPNSPTSQGVVERIVDTGTLPYARVRWANGNIGRCSITQLVTVK